MVTFDGDNLLVDFPSGITTLDTLEDLYEAWKEWLRTPGPGGSSNLGYPQLFRPIAGDQLTPTVKYTGVIFMQNQNGWRFRLPDEDITVTLTSALALEDTTVPFFTPRPGRTGAILGLAEFATGSDKLATIENELVGIEGGYGHAELMRLITASVANALTGAPGGPILLKSMNGSKTRQSTPVDESGNRQQPTIRDLSP